MSDEIDDLTLPDGWAWTVNPHDLHRGVVVHKMWWRNGKPHMRARVILLGQGGYARCHCEAEVALAVRSYRRGPRSMQWSPTVREHDLPLDPLAAAGYIELVQPELEERTLHSYFRAGASLANCRLWSDHDG